MSSTTLSLRWQRAALLGSLWAANEIVLGSFLHNVRFPFTGTLLTSIGVSLLVTGARLWDDRGVLWRAGLVCALMKSISPSAVILNPMIGILTEAWIFWLVLMIFGRNPVACITGGFIATMIPLLQQVVNIVILYGPDAARIYTVLYQLVASWGGLHAVTPLGAVFIAAFASGIPGAIAAIVGVAVARRVGTLPPPDRQPTTSNMLPTLDRVAPDQRFSLLLLFGHIVVLFAVLLLQADVTLTLEVVFVAFYVFAVFLRYPTLRRRFARPRVWVEFALVAALAGFVLGMLGPMGSWSKGVVSGLQMALRALAVVTAFSGISVELRNPDIVNWFLRRGLGALGRALDAAFRSLPTMVAALGEHLSAFRRPVETISRMFAVVLRELNELNRNQQSGPRVFVLTGAQGSGKTTLLGNLIPLLRHYGRTVAGIRAPVVMDNGTRIGYNVEDICSGDMLPLCRIDQRNAAASAGPFGFDREGLRFGSTALSLEAVAQRDVVIVDEIGPLEMKGGGWTTAVDPLLESFSGRLVLIIRPDVLTHALERWRIQPAAVWEAGRDSAGSIAAALVDNGP